MNKVQHDAVNGPGLSRAQAPAKLPDLWLPLVQATSPVLAKRSKHPAQVQQITSKSRVVGTLLDMPLLHNRSGELNPVLPVKKGVRIDRRMDGV